MESLPSTNYQGLISFRDLVSQMMFIYVLNHYWHPGSPNTDRAIIRMIKKHQQEKQQKLQSSVMKTGHMEHHLQIK